MVPRRVLIRVPGKEVNSWSAVKFERSIVYSGRGNAFGGDHSARRRANDPTHPGPHLPAHPHFDFLIPGLAVEKHLRPVVFNSIPGSSLPLKWKLADIAGEGFA